MAKTDKERARRRAWGVRNVTRKRALLDSLRGPCADCGGCFPATVMEFDHRDPDTKRLNVSSTSLQRGISMGRMKKELTHCDYVCMVCHARRGMTRRLHGEA